MTPYDGNPTTNLASAQSTASHQASGDELNFDVNVDDSVQDRVHDDGSRTDLWDGSVTFTFADNQDYVRFSFRPVDSSYAIDGKCTDASGNQVPVIHHGNHAVVLIPSSNSSFEFEMHHVAPRSSSSARASDDFSDLRIFKSKLVLSTVDPTPDDDALPIVPDPKEK